MTTTDVSFLPAEHAERWSRPRIDWRGAARMAAGRLAACAPLSDTDREALRRADRHNDEGGPPKGLLVTRYDRPRQRTDRDVHRTR